MLTAYNPDDRIRLAARPRRHRLRQCTTGVTSRTFSVMSATLQCQGICAAAGKLGAGGIVDRLGSMAIACKMDLAGLVRSLDFSRSIPIAFGHADQAVNHPIPASCLQSVGARRLFQDYPRFEYQVAFSARTWLNGASAPKQRAIHS